MNEENENVNATANVSKLPEILQQFSKQARDFATEVSNNDNFTAFLAYESKFSELIIRECADIARNSATLSDEQGVAVEQAIKNRFGVE
jgi:hypothetical protein